MDLNDLCHYMGGFVQPQWQSNPKDKRHHSPEPVPSVCSRESRPRENDSVTLTVWLSLWRLVMEVKCKNK